MTTAVVVVGGGEEGAEGESSGEEGVERAAPCQIVCGKGMCGHLMCCHALVQE
jgi:zinc transporter 1